MTKIFACEECGQVYYTNPPKECMKISMFTGKCKSTKFERIEKKDVINIHDVPQLLWNMFIEKLLG